MKPILICIISGFSIFSGLAGAQDFTACAIRLSEAVMKDDLRSASFELNILAHGSAQALTTQLSSEACAKAFWINIYNAFVQYELKLDPSLFQDRDSFFSERKITIAGHALSLDDIEHGILRRSTHKYSFGYFTNLFESDFEKTFRLKAVDFRIHFALNCGARSCPPVAVYFPDRIENQLETASRQYLQRTARYFPAEDVVRVPSVCSWYRGDFGGEAGIRRILQQYQIIGAQAKPSIEYLPYHWTLHLSNYRTF